MVTRKHARCLDKQLTAREREIRAGITELGDITEAELDIGIDVHVVICDGAALGAAVALVELAGPAFEKEPAHARAEHGASGAHAADAPSQRFAEPQQHTPADGSAAEEVEVGGLGPEGSGLELLPEGESTLEVAKDEVPDPRTPGKGGGMEGTDVREHGGRVVAGEPVETAADDRLVGLFAGRHVGV